MQYPLCITPFVLSITQYFFDFKRIITINSQRGQALLSKYSVLTEPAQGRVDATVNDIWSNPVNRIDQQPQEPSTNARTIEYAAWGVGPFEKIEDLMNVYGIDQRIYDRIKDNICV